MSSWRTVPLRHLVSKLGSGKTPTGGADSYPESGVPFLRSQNVWDDGLRLDDVVFIDEETHRSMASTRVRPNDALLNITGASIGRVALVPCSVTDANVNQHVCILRPRDTVEPRFLRYALQGPALRELLSTRDPGATMEGINFAELRGLSIRLPPSWGAQCRVADFLDCKTAVIDELIAKKERLVALLAEKREAFMTHLVTQGLDPAVPMKDSGIEWLGDVPEHWTIKRMRFVYEERAEPPLADDDVVTAFRDGQVTLRTLRRTDGFMLADKEAGYQHVEAGDLVVHGMDAFAGAIGVAEARGKCTPEYSVLRPRQRGAAQNHYYASLLRVMAQRDFIFVMCPSVRERAPRLRFATLRDMEVPVPPLPEQRTIASEIRAEAQRVAAVVRPMEASIDRLREYRRALITAAVTGQLDVTDERRVDAYDERVAEAGA